MGDSLSSSVVGVSIHHAALLRELQQARPDDPFVTWRADSLSIEGLATEDDHVAWTGRRRGRTELWATVLGDDAKRATGLLRALDRLDPLDGVTVHASAYGSLPQEFRAPVTSQWCLWSLAANRITGATHRFAAQATILDLDDSRIDELLRHSESAHIFAGAPGIIRWAGVEKDGRLLAVAGQEVEVSGAAHLVSVCCDPEFRGMGYARAVCSRLVVEADSDGSPVTILEMYAANAAGRALYAAIGFTEVREYRSGLLTPRISVTEDAA